MNGDKRDVGGLALIAVLVVLSLLLALLLPFMISMGHGDQSSRAVIAEKEVEIASISVRNLLLGKVAQSSYSADPDPLMDGLAEFPNQVEVPAPFADIGDRGQTLLAGEVIDLQRRIDLNTASPLLIANLLGLSARLSGQHEAGASELTLDDASSFPEKGIIIVSWDQFGDREVIGYGRREGNRLQDLQRGLFLELGYSKIDGEPLLDGSMVLDFRVLSAVMLPQAGRGNASERRPFESVRDLQGIESLGLPGFSAAELDILEAHCAVGGMREHATEWGKPERVFDILNDQYEQPRILHLRSAAGLGAGSVVRLRSQDGELEEYAMVWAARSQGLPGNLELESHWYLHLLNPLSKGFFPLETIIEPLVPLPINVNTADPQVLAAIFQNIRRAPDARSTGDHAAATVSQPFISRQQASEYAQRIIELRAAPEDEDASIDFASGSAFDGWEDFHLRFIKPLLDEASSFERKNLLRMVYENCLIGRPASLDMGTASLVFHSSPLVSYRASALRRRAGGQEDARMERKGLAYVSPNTELFWGVATQEMLEESIRLDRRHPHWMTYPINTGASDPLDRGTNPVPRTNAHILADAFPEMGFGQRRFPLREGGASAMGPLPASTPFSHARFGSNLYAEEPFAHSYHPEGWDMRQEGRYEIRNNGSRAQGNSGNAATDHSRISAAFTEGPGLTSRHAISFWFKLKDLSPQGLYDLASARDAIPDRNRISLQIVEEKLVFEVIDEAGIDPNPAERDTSPERSSGIWEIPLADLPIEAEAWYHVSLSAMGNRPGQITMLLDGTPRGDPQGRTYLTAPIPAFDRNRGVLNDYEDKERYVPVRVDSTEDFPQRGVLRIGLELFEYVSKDGQTFYCLFEDSMGGRSARMEQAEYNVSIPEEYEGEDRDELLKILNRDDSNVVTPDHPAGSAVVLYGYTVPIYPQTVLQVGSSELTGSLGPFAVARVINHQGVPPITVTFETRGGGSDSITLGNGLDMTYSGDIELGDPVSASLPTTSARQEVLSTFSESGGYALLVQRRMSFQPPVGVQSGSNTEVGGVEVIRYGSRRGTTLSGVIRNARLEGVNLTQDSESFFQPGMARQFITNWRIRFGDTSADLNELPLYSTYVVPISLSITGNPPPTQDLVQWVQLYPGEGREEDSEWVRYNLVVENRFLVRAEQRAWDRLRFSLTQQSGLDALQLGRQGGTDSINGGADAAALNPWNMPDRDSGSFIGHRHEIEYDLPAIAAARSALRFRGDLGTGSHEHDARSRVLPVHRFEFAWGSYGVSAARAGRNDRIALVQGSRRENGGIPDVEWHSVNWSSRNYSSDRVNEDGTAARPVGYERTGDWPFQLVAFRDEVRSIFIGEAEPSYDNLRDSRLVDRMVKYPSGELPAADVDHALIGSAVHSDRVEVDGIFDELGVVTRYVTPRPLDSTFTENAVEFFVRPDVIITPNGGLVGGLQPAEWTDHGVLSAYPEYGGLLMIDGEILAYRDYDQGRGRFEIAEDGRGLLGTEARAHDEGATVYFLEQVPAGILSSGANASDHELPLQGLGGLPRHAGTVLMGRELLHYTWTSADSLVMPFWVDPREERSRRSGLFRGRFGTDPNPAAAGSPVIFFPTRFWDRYRPRAEDPEISALTVTLQQGPAWFTGIAWEEEDPQELVDLQCLVRIDGYGGFADDPEKNSGLYHFTEGSINGDLHPLDRAGSRIELHFATVYHPGCFDAATFLPQDWKRGPIIKGFLLRYQGETRILRERVSVR